MSSDQRIDGLTFLLMNENNFNELGFLLGPKIKILNFISHIKRHIEVDYDFSESKLKAKETQKTPLIDRQMKTEIGCGDVAHNDDHKAVKETKTYKSYKCRECDKTYSKVQYVRDHEMTVHYNSGYNYSCRVCGHAFGWRVAILKHIKRYHPEKKSSEMIVTLF